LCLLSRVRSHERICGTSSRKECIVLNESFMNFVSYDVLVLASAYVSYEMCNARARNSPATLFSTNSMSLCLHLRLLYVSCHCFTVVVLCWGGVLLPQSRLPSQLERFRSVIRRVDTSHLTSLHLLHFISSHSTFCSSILRRVARWKSNAPAPRYGHDATCSLQ
jgi:hypothetical protein